jgi:hypothetical protein
MSSRFSAEEKRRVLAAARATVRQHLAARTKGHPVTKPVFKADGSVDFEHGDLRPILAATAEAYDIFAKTLPRIAALEAGRTKGDHGLRGGGAANDESQRVLRRAELCGEDSLNELDKWRLRGARDEQARVERRRTEERARQRQQDDEVDALRIEMRRELTNLREELERQYEIMMGATGEALGEYGNKIADHTEKLVRGIQNELQVAVERRFGELMGRLDAILPDTRSRAEKTPFKFATEDDGDVVNDLPNPSTVRKMN